MVRTVTPHAAGMTSCALLSLSRHPAGLRPERRKGTGRLARSWFRAPRAVHVRSNAGMQNRIRRNGRLGGIAKPCYYAPRAGPPSVQIVPTSTSAVRGLARRSNHNAANAQTGALGNHAMRMCVLRMAAMLRVRPALVRGNGPSGPLAGAGAPCGAPPNFAAPPRCPKPCSRGGEATFHLQQDAESTMGKVILSGGVQVQAAPASATRAHATGSPLASCSKTPSPP